ncbi:response regulator [Paenibacillus sp. P26]|nr:response regulator [Paenibacillus sp. P26]
MKPITILIADDEPEIADLIELHLLKEGYRCIKVSDGLEAVQVIRTKPVDLAILDIMMPNLDGYEATHSSGKVTICPLFF